MRGRQITPNDVAGELKALDVIVKNVADRLNPSTSRSDEELRFDLAEQEVFEITKNAPGPEKSPNGCEDVGYIFWGERGKRKP